MYGVQHQAKVDQTSASREFPGIYPMLNEFHDRLRKARVVTDSMLNRLRGAIPMETAENGLKEPNEPSARELLGRIEREILGLEADLESATHIIG